MINSLLVTFALTPLSLGAGAATEAGAEVSLSVRQAVAEGKIDLEIHSLGRSTGPCMKVVVRRRVPHTLSLKINSGTVFKSTSGKVQDMVGAKVLGEFNIKANTYRPDGLMVLSDDAEHSFVLEAYCLDSGKPTPGLKEGFTLGGIDVAARGVLELAFSRNASTSDVQMALWIDRPMAAGVTLESLMERVSATQANVRAARSLLAQLRADGLERWIGSVGLEQLEVQHRVTVEGSPLGGFPMVPPVIGNLNIEARVSGVAPAALRVLGVSTHEEATVVGRDGASTNRTAGDDKKLLVLRVALLRPALGALAEEFSVRVDDVSVEAFALAPSSRAAAPEGIPTFRLPPADSPPRLLPRLLQNEWLVGFEIAAGASKGTVAWRGSADVEWTLED